MKIRSPINRVRVAEINFLNRIAANIENKPRQKMFAGRRNKTQKFVTLFGKLRRLCHGWFGKIFLAAESISPN